MVDGFPQPKRVLIKENLYGQQESSTEIQKRTKVSFWFKIGSPCLEFKSVK